MGSKAPSHNQPQECTLSDSRKPCWPLTWSLGLSPRKTGNEVETRLVKTGRFPLSAAPIAISMASGWVPFGLGFSPSDEQKRQELADFC